MVDLNHAGQRPWEIEEISNKPHPELALAMKASAFFVCLNTREGFNVTVPEAMAAGCVAVCYDAFGGLDFLKNGENAYVFPNDHIYPLADKLLELIENYEHKKEELSKIAQHAYETAGRYHSGHTRQALHEFYSSFNKL